MKIFHTKKQNRKWTLVFETEEEARNFHHLIGCRKELRACSVQAVQKDEFQQELHSLILQVGMPV